MNANWKRAVAAAVWVVSLAGVATLSGCGSGGSASADATGSAAEAVPAGPPGATTLAVAGRVAPAVRGLVFVEYDDEGNELQYSTRTDVSGQFGFARRLSGVRIEARSLVLDMRLPTILSSTVERTDAVLTVTQLTSVHDQLQQRGLSQSQARDALVSMVSGACGQSAGAAVFNAVTASQSLSPDSAWLQPAFTAYITAFQSLGVNFETEGGDWANRLQQRSAVLGRLCDVAKSLYSDAWLASEKAMIETDLKTTLETKDLETLSTVRDYAASQVLALVAGGLTSLEHPMLADYVGARSVTWLGNEQRVALDLALAEFRSRALVTRAAPGALVAPTNGASYALDFTGKQVASVSARATGNPAQPAVVRFSNISDEDRPARLIVNDTSLADFDGALAEILAVPQTMRGEMLHQRAWRYLVARRRHKDPISGGLFMNQADLYLRSLGSGYCDNVAGVLHWLWRGMGYEARVIGLTGHVVPEVKINGRWEMYDPDYGVFFYNRQGQVASVDDIANDPALLTNPIKPTLPPGSEAYSQMIADFYSSQENNFVHYYYSVPIEEPLNNVFTIPHGGYLEVVSAANYTMPTAVDNTTVDLAPIRLWFPPGYTGTISLPMILANVRGDAKVTMMNNSFDVTSDGLEPAILAYYRSAPTRGITTISIDRVGAGGLTLTMTANPLYFLPTLLTARVYGPVMSGIVVGSDAAAGQ
jgi:hypothetical protein